MRAPDKQVNVARVHHIEFMSTTHAGEIEIFRRFEIQSHQARDIYNILM